MRIFPLAIFHIFDYGCLGGIYKESTGRQKALEPHLSRHMDDWEKERVENFPLRFQGQVVRRDENDRLEWMDARKRKFLVKFFTLF